MNETIETTLKRLESNKAIVGVLVLTHEGKIIKSTLPDNIKTTYSSLLTQLISTAHKTVQQLDQQDDLTFLRLRTKKHEFMIASEKEYLLIVIQNISTNAS